MILTATGIVCPLYGISLFLPTIIRGLGYRSSTAQLLTVPIYITASVLAIAVAWWSDRVGKRYPFILTCLCIMAVGFIMCVASSTPGVIYAGVFIAACALYPAFPGNITWLSNSKSQVQITEITILTRPRSGWIHQACDRTGYPDCCRQSRRCNGIKLLSRTRCTSLYPRTCSRAWFYRSRNHRSSCVGVQLQENQCQAGAPAGGGRAQRLYSRGAGRARRPFDDVQIRFVDRCTR